MQLKVKRTLMDTFSNFTMTTKKAYLDELLRRKHKGTKYVRQFIFTSRHLETLQRVILKHELDICISYINNNTKLKFHSILYGIISIMVKKRKISQYFT